MMKQQMIEDNINLVYHIINQYYPTYMYDEDIIQSGMVGLCKAVDLWDEEKSKFSTFAAKCIRNEIIQEFRSRNKHKGILSLDYEVHDKDGEKVSFGDFCVGDEDVDYVDLDYIYDEMTEEEIRICKLKQSGLSACEISKQVGKSYNFVCRVIRKFKILWGYANGN